MKTLAIVGVATISGIALAAPPALTPVKPMAGATVTSPVLFLWQNVGSTGEAVRYEIEVSEPAAQMGMTGRRVAQATGGDGNQGVTVAGLPAGMLTWSVRAVAASGEAGPWSAPTGFTVAPVDRVPDMSAAPGCRLSGGLSGKTSGRRGAAASLVVLGLALAALLVRRRLS